MRLNQPLPRKTAPGEGGVDSGGFRSLFDNFFSSQRPLFSLSEKVWNPPADVYETCDSLVVKMEIAGVEQKELDIVVENGLLVVRGRRQEDHPMPKENYHLMEIRYGRFERLFRLPPDVRTDSVEASYANGFLLVTLAKEEPVVRKIEVTIHED